MQRALGPSLGLEVSVVPTRGAGNVAARSTHDDVLAYRERSADVADGQVPAAPDLFGDAGHEVHGDPFSPPGTSPEDAGTAQGLVPSTVQHSTVEPPRLVTTAVAKSRQ